MRLAIPILMQAGLAWGACPTAGGYANTCFVSVLGSDTIGTGTITEPYRSLQKAADTAAPGDTVMIRGGRHTTAALSFISPGTSGAVQAPITFRAFQGEAAIIDGGNVAGRRFLLMLPANTHGSHYHFAGLKFENWHYYSNIATIQGRHPGIEFRATRMDVDGGSVIVNPAVDGTGYKVLGSHWEMGRSIQCTISDTGVDDDYAGACPPGTTHLLLQTVTPNTGACTLDIGDGRGPQPIRTTTNYDLSNNYFAGNGHGFRLRWNTDRWEVLGGTLFDCSVASGTNNGDYVGCDGILIQDSVFRRIGAASDHVAFEAGSGILLNRIDVRSSKANNDCLDVKSNNVTLSDVSVFGCGAKGMGIWGYSTWRNVRSDGPSFLGAEYTSRIINGAIDDGGFIRITANYNPYGGQVPIPGHRVAISNVQGCTGANGIWLVKDAVSKDVFRIMGDNGEGTSCSGTFVSSPGSSIRMAPALNGPSGDVRFASVQREGSLPGVWVTGSGQAHKVSVYDSVFSNLNAATGYGFCIGKTAIRSSGRNQFFSARGQVYDLDYGNDCALHSGHLLSTYEPDSHHGAANLDQATFRATAASPATIADRGYYAGTNTAIAGVTRQIVRFRAPAATDSCTVVLDDSADFGSIEETIASGPGRRWREVVFGAATPLSAGTTYYHKITCGHDVFTGSAATLNLQAGTAAVSVTLAGGAVEQSEAALDFSVDGSSWTSGASQACGAGCALSTAQLNRGQIYWFRSRRIGAAGATLAVGEAWPALVL